MPAWPAWTTWSNGISPGAPGDGTTALSAAGGAACGAGDPPQASAAPSARRNPLTGVRAGVISALDREVDFRLPGADRDALLGRLQLRVPDRELVRPRGHPLDLVAPVGRQPRGVGVLA